MTNQIIPIVKGIIGQAEVNTVNARELHEFLGVETRFNDWIVRRVEEYGFVDGQDYVRIDSSNLSNQTGRGGDRRSIDYHLTLDMGKELSMVEKTPKGREARRYFIECERRALGGESTSSELPAWQNTRFSIPKRVAMFLEANPGVHHNSEIDHHLGLVSKGDKQARIVGMKRMAKNGLVQKGRWPGEWSISQGVVGRVNPHAPTLRVAQEVQMQGSLEEVSDIAVRFGYLAAAKSEFMDAGSALFSSIKKQAVSRWDEQSSLDKHANLQTVYAAESAFYALDRVLDCINCLTRSVHCRA